MCSQNQPFFSIIISLYNCEKYIQECIESVLAQSETSYEIVVVDDGSTDSSCKIVEALQAKNACIRLLHQDHKQLAPARNFGIQNSHGVYLLFLDADDLYLDSSFLEYARSQLEKQPVDYVSCRAVQFKKEIPQTINSRHTFQSYERDEALRELSNTNMLAMPAWLHPIKREFVLAHQLFFDESILGDFEDLEYMFRVLTQVRHMGILPFIYYGYRRHPEQASRGKRESYERHHARMAALKASLAQIQQAHYPTDLELNLLDYICYTWCTTVRLAHDITEPEARRQALEEASELNFLTAYAKTQPTRSFATLIRVFGNERGGCLLKLLQNLKGLFK